MVDEDHGDWMNKGWCSRGSSSRLGIRIRVPGFDAEIAGRSAGKQASMSWSQPQSQPQAGWQQHPFQTQAFDFHLVPVIEALADAVEGGARDQQVDELVHELAARFQKAEQILNSLGSNATEKDVATQKKTLEDHRNKLEERRALLLKYKSMVDRIYPADA